jgi:hypothetical protein
LSSAANGAGGQPSVAVASRIFVASAVVLNGLGSNSALRLIALFRNAEPDA